MYYYFNDQENSNKRAFKTCAEATLCEESTLELKKKLSAFQGPGKCNARANTKSSSTTQTTTHN